MARWPLGVFTSLDAGLGVSFDVLSRLGIPTIHLHAPESANRSAATATRMAGDLEKLGVEITCVFVIQAVGCTGDAIRTERHHDRRNHEGDRLATTFGSRLLSGGGQKEAQPQSPL